MIKEKFQENENVFDESKISIFKHYFMAMSNFINQKDEINYNLLKNNAIEFVLNLRLFLFKSKDEIIFYLTKMKQYVLICKKADNR